MASRADVYTVYTPNLVTFATVSVDDVLRAISMSPSKQCPSDPLPTWLLKKCAFNVASFITRILNLSLTGGDFPSPWKHAIATPLLKKAGLDDSIVSSYRPDSNLSHLSKILERMVHRQVISHLEEFKLLPDFQSAYRRGHSTETAVLKVYSDLIDAISNGKFVLLSLLDLTVAFDTVDHNILLHHLETTFGFRGVPLQWMCSYLDGRTQSILLGGKSTADNNQLYSSCKQHGCAALKSIRINCVESIGEWMSSNRFILNPSKSKFMRCASQRRMHLIDRSAIVLPDGLVNVSLSLRNLGAYFDESMSMTEHRNHLVHSCFNQLR